MDKKFMLEGLADRKEELTRKVGTLLDKEKATQRYHVKRDINVLSLIEELLKTASKDVGLSEKAVKTFLQLTEPQQVTVTTVEVKMGDRILDLMQKYADVKNLLPRLEKAANKVGCTVNFNSGLIEPQRGEVIAEPDEMRGDIELEEVA
jgi:hypothetical protein